MTGTWLTEDVFVQQIPAPYTLNSVQWVKLYSNLPISDPRQVSWGHSHAVHEVVKSQLNLVQLHRINQDILGPDQIIPWKYLLISFFHFQCPFCVCVFVCVWISLCLSDKLSEVGGLERNGCVSIWGLMIDGQLWLPPEYVVAGKNPWRLVHLQRVGTGSTPQRHTIHMPSHCCISNNLLKPTETGKRISVSLIEMPLSEPPPIVTTSTLKHHGTCIIGTCTLNVSLWYANETLILYSVGLFALL